MLAPEPLVTESDRGGRGSSPRRIGSGLERCLEELPATQREAVALRAFAEQAFEEIAETMRTTVGAVKSLLHRAKASLAGCFRWEEPVRKDFFATMRRTAAAKRRTRSSIARSGRSSRASSEAMARWFAWDGCPRRMARYRGRRPAASRCSSSITLCRRSAAALSPRNWS